MEEEKNHHDVSKRETILPPSNRMIQLQSIDDQSAIQNHHQIAAQNSEVQILEERDQI